jgi:dethiobiotin synthetase
MNTSPSFFVTGTDTEVGKTLVSGALILKLREQNKHVVGFKPVVAGTYLEANGKPLNEDLETLRIASHLSPEELNLCPYVLDTPAAPHIAAAQLGLQLDLATIIKAYELINIQAESVIVEGAGGFLIPLNTTEDLSDFAAQINLPVILVVGMRLGCINHALLTVEAIESRKLKIAGWVANSLSSKMDLLEDNIQALQTRIHAPFLGLIPTLPKELKKPNNAPYTMAALQFAAKHIQLPL